jgi:hypothetical protein
LAAAAAQSTSKIQCDVSTAVWPASAHPTKLPQHLQLG